MILNLLGQDTNREPMKSLMAKAREVEKRPGVLSVSLMAGFPYADVPEMGPSVIAVADGSAEQAAAVADELAAEMWAVREQLYVACPDPREAVTRAIASGWRPVLLVDLGDNIGGGSAGDGTVLLAELLRQQATGFVVVLYAPKAVELAQAAGAGGTFEAAVGGAVDRLHGEPVHVRGVVKSLHDGKWVETEARHGGRRDNDQGPTAVDQPRRRQHAGAQLAPHPAVQPRAIDQRRHRPGAGQHHRGEGGSGLQGGLRADRRPRSSPWTRPA